MALTKITGEGVGAVDSLSVDGSTIKLDGNYPTGSGNVALGNAALDDAGLSGGFNVAVGSSALGANTSGNDNTSLGTSSMSANTTGSDNTAVGRQALLSNTTASNNTAVGYQSLYANTIGTNNAGHGYRALYLNTEGSNHTALGAETLAANTTGANNTAVGYFALTAATTASNNTAVGKGSGQSLTTGAGNTFLGVSAGGAITTGSKNVVLGQYNGNQDGVDIRTVSNQIILSDGDGNVRVRLNQSELICAGVYAETTGSGTNMTVLSSGSIRRSTSSLRYKNTVNDATHGLAELLALRPVTYKGNNDGDTVFGGLIAEEVHDAGLTEFVQYDDEGRADALAYGNMVSLCIKAIQEQQETITALEARIAALEGAN
jgi:hypothetical protein